MTTTIKTELIPELDKKILQLTVDFTLGEIITILLSEMSHINGVQDLKYEEIKKIAKLVESKFDFSGMNESIREALEIATKDLLRTKNHPLY